jgi:hypothetical protein
MPELAKPLFLRPAIALQNKLIEFLGLLSDPVCDPLLVLTAGGGGRLLDKLPKVVSQDRDATIEFGKR